MRRAITLVEVLVASAVCLVTLIVLFELFRLVNRATFASSRSLTVSQAGVMLMEHLVDDLEAALPDRSWNPSTATTPTFLADESLYEAGGGRYGTGFSLFRSSPQLESKGVVRPLPVSYDVNIPQQRVVRTAGSDRKVYEGIEFFAVAPYRIGQPARKLFRVLLLARSTEVGGDLQIRALPLTTAVCPRFLRYYQALPHWAWAEGQWESRFSP